MYIDSILSIEATFVNITFQSSRHVALPNYTENCSLFYSPWILETVAIKTINKKAFIIIETFDQQNVGKNRWREFFAYLII